MSYPGNYSNAIPYGYSPYGANAGNRPTNPMPGPFPTPSINMQPGQVPSHPINTHTMPIPGVVPPNLGANPMMYGNATYPPMTANPMTIAPPGAPIATSHYSQPTPQWYHPGNYANPIPYGMPSTYGVQPQVQQQVQPQIYHMPKNEVKPMANPLDQMFGKKSTPPQKATTTAVPTTAATSAPTNVASATSKPALSSSSPPGLEFLMANSDLLASPKSSSGTTPPGNARATAGPVLTPALAASPVKTAAAAPVKTSAAVPPKATPNYSVSLIDDDFVSTPTKPATTPAVTPFVAPLPASSPFMTTPVASVATSQSHPQNLFTTAAPQPTTPAKTTSLIDDFGDFEAHNSASGFGDFPPSPTKIGVPAASPVNLLEQPVKPEVKPSSHFAVVPNQPPATLQSIAAASAAAPKVDTSHKVSNRAVDWSDTSKFAGLFLVEPEPAPAPANAPQATTAAPFASANTATNFASPAASTTAASTSFRTSQPFNTSTSAVSHNFPSFGMDEAPLKPASKAVDDEWGGFEDASHSSKSGGDSEWSDFGSFETYNATTSHEELSGSVLTDFPEQNITKKKKKEAPSIPSFPKMPQMNPAITSETFHLPVIPKMPEMNPNFETPEENGEFSPSFFGATPASGPVVPTSSSVLGEHMASFATSPPESPEDSPRITSAPRETYVSSLAAMTPDFNSSPQKAPSLSSISKQLASMPVQQFKVSEVPAVTTSADEFNPSFAFPTDFSEINQQTFQPAISTPQATPQIIPTMTLSNSQEAAKGDFDTDEFGDFSAGGGSNADFESFVDHKPLSALLEDLIQQERMDEARLCQEHIKNEEQVVVLQNLYDQAVNEKRTSDVLDTRDKLERIKVFLHSKDAITRWRTPNFEEQTLEQMKQKIAAKFGFDKARAFEFQFNHNNLVATARSSISNASAMKKQAKQAMESILSETDQPKPKPVETPTISHAHIQPNQVKNWQNALDHCFSHLEKAQELLEEIQAQDKAVSDEVLHSEKYQFYLYGLAEVFTIACRLKAVVNRYPQALSMAASSGVSTFFLIDKIDTAWKAISDLHQQNNLNVDASFSPPENWEDTTSTCNLCVIPVAQKDLVFFRSSAYHKTCASFYAQYFVK
eukprot:TRINITY_DN5672_c0_g1_i1.p1 TRINITY_DN5672_c0_g1~~TRINITY_DN5672_c0_g1_i1.p1  ORF type:complete len:1113 (+),score=293.45 TRINITY_DN5672_c0_g1_i1:190-3528(+)